MFKAIQYGQPRPPTNYFRTAVRNLAKNKFFTVLNVLGLALGMSISLLFIAGLTFLYTFDNFHTDADQIYRVTTHRKDNSEHYASAPAGLVQRFGNDFRGVEKVVGIYGSLSGEIIYRDNKINLNGYFLVANTKAANANPVDNLRTE